MTEMRFDLEGSLDLPVEVYDADLTLVDRTLSSGSVSVDPGTYFVEARLPDGSRLRRAVEVSGEPRTAVALEPAAQEAVGELEGPPSVLERMQIGGGLGRAARREMGRLAALTFYRRDGGGDWRETGRESKFARAGDPVRPPVGTEAVALRRDDGLLTIVPIPGGREDLMRFAFRSAAEDKALLLDARLANDAADAILSFLNLDLLEDARLMAEAPEFVAETLLRTKVEDPLAAAAGAFALLRMNALDRLYAWTTNLSNWFLWLPDGAVALAEQRARHGDHEGAAELLLQLPERGVPVLSVGLAFAVERLRTYSAYWPDNSALRAVLVELTRYALATDFAAPVTTFVGGDPDSPEPAHLDDSPLRDRGAGSVKSPSMERSWQ